MWFAPSHYRQQRDRKAASYCILKHELVESAMEIFPGWQPQERATSLVSSSAARAGKGGAHRSKGGRNAPSLSAPSLLASRRTSQDRPRGDADPVAARLNGKPATSLSNSTAEVGDHSSANGSDAEMRIAFEEALERALAEAVSAIRAKFVPEKAAAANGGSRGEESKGMSSSRNPAELPAVDE